MNTKNKRIKIPKSKIVEYWYNNKDHYNCFVDLEEPNCWACGKPFDVRYDRNITNLSGKESFKIWDKVDGLQICHIAPKSLGGSDDYSNLFLMCKYCHEESPDTIYPEILFKWIESRCYLDIEMRKLKDTFDNFGFNYKKIDKGKLKQITNSIDFKEFINKKAGLHRSLYGGAKLKESSYIGLLIKYINYNNIDIYL